MSDLGDCPDCGTPYGVRRRCYRCKPGRGTNAGKSGGYAARVADPTPEEIDTLSAEIRGDRPVEPAVVVPDKREMLRQAMAERAAEERRKVRDERESTSRRVAAGPSLPPPTIAAKPDAARRPAPATIDPEVAAISVVFDALNGLDERARDRVLVYMRERFQIGF